MEEGEEREEGTLQGERKGEGRAEQEWSIWVRLSIRLHTERRRSPEWCVVEMGR